MSLITGTQHIGQGHETTFPQILADRLGLPNELIKLRQGDTDLIAHGGGHGSSRATYMGGTAIFRAAEEIVLKGTRVAAEMLEAAAADIQFEDGDFVVSGTDRRVVAHGCRARPRATLATPLDTYHFWTREFMTFPNGTHVAEVEIDPDTGQVTLESYSAVDDYGVLVNPMVASGQAHGAIAQGTGQALLEQAVYDPESGQMIAASFMDYRCRAPTICRRSASPSTRRGARPIRSASKAAGEAGTIAAFPAIHNAIHDALAAAGGKSFDGPATPARVWRATQK